MNAAYNEIFLQLYSMYGEGIEIVSDWREERLLRKCKTPDNKYILVVIFRKDEDDEWVIAHLALRYEHFVWMEHPNVTG